ncbi:lytic murein transglycosylase [Sulfurimonas sp.]|nr:lytic murein transglycosylase [Sulfurimonas sp.]
MTKLLLLLLVLNSAVFAKYTTCFFQNSNYIDVCERSVKQGVSIEYANKFLLSYFKTQKFDEVSYKYLQPKYIKSHRKNEKKANNVLVKHVPRIIAHLKKYKEVYDYTEKKFGVNREIIAAILTKETNLGKIQPKHDAFLVFNTLVRRVKPDTKRNKWLLNMGKTNMVSIISHCYKKGVEPEECNLPSSYAGAVGIPQFMPNSFVYTQSYKGKVADLTKMEDAIVSASKFLHQKAKFSELIEWDLMPDVVKIEAQWYDYEFDNDNASFVYAESKRSGKKYDCFTCGKVELVYMKSYAKKIMRYNNSSNYAVGVLRLAYDANKGLYAKKQ